MAMKWRIKLEATSKRCPIVFQYRPSNFKATRDNKSPILTPIERFRTVTLVWIHRWLWNDAQSLKQQRRGALLFVEVIHHISRSYGTKKSPILTPIERFQTVNPVLIHQWLWNDAQSLKQQRRGALLFVEVIHQISRSHGTTKSPILTPIERFQTVSPVLIHRWLWNDAQSLM